MISKSLFKQSAKANGVMWAIITFAVCFMLACVMVIAGSGSVGQMRVGITNTIVEGAINSKIEDSSVNNYSVVNQGLTNFDTMFLTKNQYYLSQGVPSDQASSLAYRDAINMLKDTYMPAVAESATIEIGSSEYNQMLGFMLGCFDLDLDGDGVSEYADFYNNHTEISPYSLSNIMDANRANYIRDYAINYCSSFFAYNMVSESTINAMLDNLKDYKYTLDDYIGLTYDITVGENTQSVSRYVGSTGYDYIKDLSRSSIVKYDAELSDAISQIVTTGKTDQQINAEKQAITASIRANYGKSFLQTLPADVSSSLEELGAMDLYGMIIGSIFFKMAGLLLPIIYIIMVANNLIAGQVDSGSMAYILSTSTKRRQVICTQALFLVSSLFLMFTATTITGCICLHFVDGKYITLTVKQLILLNAGAFVTLFAMSGISFLASCWFNRSKYSMSLGGGLNMFFLVATMLGLFGSQVLPSVVRLKSLNFFNYCSIITLFDELSILGGTTTFIWKLAILFVMGLVAYIVGGVKFERKDLPL